MRVHNKVLEGPDVAQSFKVLSGVAVVFGPDFGLPIPAGGTWPGAQLSQRLADTLQPAFVQLLPGTTITTDVCSADIQAGEVLVHAIALIKGPFTRRLALLSQEAVMLGNSTTVAGALSATREHLAKTRHQRPKP